MSNSDLVLGMCSAWRTRDTEKVLSYLSADCFYHNIPIAPAVGHDAIREFVGGFMGILEDVEFVVRHIAEGDDGVVLTERVDRLKVQGNWIDLPVMGAFEIRDGKIAVWRDYYDQRFMEQALASAAAPSAAT